MMTTNCSIVEDLLPLYTEGLLQEETTVWLEAHLEGCVECRKLAETAFDPVMEKQIPSPINNDKMIAKINFRLSIYQIIFVGISFFLAMQTTLLNESFGFILSYTILGLITYLFYKNIKIVITISFFPVFIWSSWELFFDFQSMIGSFSIAVIHLIFALIGSAIGALILKLRESEEEL